MGSLASRRTQLEGARNRAAQTAAAPCSGTARPGCDSKPCFDSQDFGPGESRGAINHAMIAMYQRKRYIYIYSTDQYCIVCADVDSFVKVK